MWYYLLKLVISAALIVVVSEVSKRYATIGGLLASLPLISYLAFIWLYIDTHDKAKVAALSWSILWLVIPSLSLFVALPLLMKKLAFVPSLIVSTLIMFACYAGTMALLKKLGYAALTT
ncbi:MAG: hypothetical protein GC159_20800 [Phycisphaera sp.]|nr:hypothetical protein [Phycisphaera sp.]